MAASPNHIVITNPDGSTTTLDVTYAPAPVTPPPPPPPPAPAPIFVDGANLVTIAGKSYALTAIDPPTTDPTMPGGRGQDQLIIVTKVATPARNKWGYELLVDIATGKVLAASTNVSVDSTTYVLSGHGLAANFLRTIAMSAVVQVTKSTPAPPTPPPTPSPTTVKNVGVYRMDGAGDIPAGCNWLLIAFYQGSDLVDWGASTPAKMSAETNAWRQSKPDVNKTLVSLGGSGGTVVLSSVPQGLLHINTNHFKVDGVDFDAEAFSYTPAQAVTLCTDSATTLGISKADFIVQLTPPGGSPVAAAIQAAKALKAAGFVHVYLCHQLYETSVTDSQVMSAIDEEVNAVGEEYALVGIMIGDSYGSWSVASASTRMKAILAKYPKIGGVAIWNAGRPGTTETANNMAALFGLM
jgi:hypothetical protein